jgi:hypothetical protein
LPKQELGKIASTTDSNTEKEVVPGMFATWPVTFPGNRKIGSVRGSEKPATRGPIASKIRMQSSSLRDNPKMTSTI